MPSLSRLALHGFKSIGDMSVDLGRMNVLIGPNGAGKSNFLSFFRMLNALSAEQLQLYVGKQGGANSLLHYGRKRTPQVSAEMTFESDQGAHDEYRFSLVGVAPDDLMFADEVVSHRPAKSKQRALQFGGGHRESKLDEGIRKNDTTSRTVKWSIDRWRVYHFHDTSSEAPIKQKCRIEDNRYLKTDGANLAAFLYMLKSAHGAQYGRIRDTIRLCAPFFDDFVLEPDLLHPGFISLQWREKGEAETFFAHQLSDGTLRFIALTTALSQPQDLATRPHLILVDEPELGLHPYAITLLVSMMRATSETAQVIVSTQSVNLIDELADPAEIIVVERENGQSVFRRPDPAALERWLDEYSLGELWEKNVLGGRP